MFTHNRISWDKTEKLSKAILKMRLMRAFMSFAHSVSNTVPESFGQEHQLLLNTGLQLGFYSRNELDVESSSVLQNP